VKGNGAMLSTSGETGGKEASKTAITERGESSEQKRDMGAGILKERQGGLQAGPAPFDRQIRPVRK